MAITRAYEVASRRNKPYVNLEEWADVGTASQSEQGKGVKASRPLSKGTILKCCFVLWIAGRPWKQVKDDSDGSEKEHVPDSYSIVLHPPGQGYFDLKGSKCFFLNCPDAVRCVLYAFAFVFFHKGCVCCSQRNVEYHIVQNGCTPRFRLRLTKNVNRGDELFLCYHKNSVWSASSHREYMRVGALPFC
jgi:hypothetical protein